jgi:branched-chain amino acid transport system permease protein
MRQSSAPQIVLIVVLLTAWGALALVFDNSYYRLLMAVVPIWAAFAVSWNIFSGYSGLLSFGHAAFFGIGAFTVALSLKYLDLSPWFSIPLAIVLGAIAGAGIGFVTLRLKGIYFSLSMLAYPLVLVYVFQWLGFQEVTLPIKRDNPIAYMQFGDYRAYVLLALVLLFVALMISLRVERSRFGMSLLAIKQNQLAAEAAGVDTFLWKMKALVLSAALSAAAGGLYGALILVITPESVFGLVTTAQAAILTIFGGAGALWGPLIGAVTLVPLSEILQAQLGHVLPGIQGVIFGIAIILVVRLAPEGAYWRVRDLLTRRKHQPAATTTSVSNVTAMPSARAAQPAAAAPDWVLQVRNISRHYGGLKAVNDVSFDVARGEILGIIGPNGAGKTTLFNLLNGIVRPNSGQVLFEGQRIDALEPNQICRLGLARTFQVVRPFRRMSVIENVVVGAYVAHASEDEAWTAAAEALAQVGLSERAQTLAGSLTNKELRLMELARALAGRPKLVLMDEPLAGLGATETKDVIAVIKSLRESGISVVIIEHTMHAMVSVVDRFVVLDQGKFLVEGRPAAVTQDKRVIEAYLGRKWALANAAR